MVSTNHSALSTCLSCNLSSPSPSLYCQLWKVSNQVYVKLHTCAEMVEQVCNWGSWDCCFPQLLSAPCLTIVSTPAIPTVSCSLCRTCPSFNKPNILEWLTTLSQFLLKYPYSRHEPRNRMLALRRVLCMDSRIVFAWTTKMCHPRINS